MVPLKQKGQVCLSACKTYAFEEVHAALREQLDALHVEELLFPGCRVVIKPNLVIRSKPEEGVITHPARGGSCGGGAFGARRRACDRGRKPRRALYAAASASDLRGRRIYGAGPNIWIFLEF